MKKDTKTSRKVPASIKDLIEPSTAAKAAESGGDAAAVPAKKSRARESIELAPEIEIKNHKERPLIWRDLEDFRSRHNRTISDVVYDLALLTTHNYAKNAAKRTMMPVDLEILIRLYDRYPSSCAWHRVDVRETFEVLYGAMIAGFPEQLQTTAHLACARRYSVLVGRADTAQYRWLKGESQISRRLTNLLAKVMEIKTTNVESREVFEAVAVRTWALRGIDINERVPLPTLQSVQKPPGTRGRRMPTHRVAKPAKTHVYEGGAFA
jgi:hypothetical protein